MSKTTQFATSKEQAEIALTRLFAIRQQIADLKLQETELQETVDAFSNTHINFFTDGKLSLDTGMIKVQSSPPKLVYEATGKPLTPAERVALASELDQEYVENKPFLAKIAKMWSSDKLLKRFLKAKGVAVIREEKYQAKPY